MGFCHGMVDRDEMLLFCRFNLDLVEFVQRFRLQGRKRHTAAADDGISHGVNDVAADGADIQFGAEQIGGRILVDDGIAFHQLHDGDTRGGGERLDE